MLEQETKSGLKSCSECGHNVLDVEGCAYSQVSIDGVLYDRVKFGGLGDLFDSEDNGGRCSGCGARLGYFHHVTCPLEICPQCGDWLVSCACEKDMVYC